MDIKIVQFYQLLIIIIKLDSNSKPLTVTIKK